MLTAAFDSHSHSLGGHGVFGMGAYVEKTLTDLPPHDGLRIQFSFLKVDQWNGRQGVLLLDGADIWRTQVYHQQGGYAGGGLATQVRGDNGCGIKGYNQGDLSVDSDVTADHYASNATLRFTSTLDQNGDYWGIQDVRISLVLAHPSPPAPPTPPGVWEFVMRDRWPGATGWSGGNVSLAETATTSPVTRCGTLGSFFGGFGNFGAGSWVEKLQPGLPSHTGLRVRFTFLKVDNWQGGKGQLYVDDSLIWESPTMHGEPRISDGVCDPGASGNGGGDCCGVINYQQGDSIYSGDVTFSHYASTARIRFTSNEYSSTAYWGINDVRVTLATNHPSPPAPPAAPGVWSAVLYDRWPGASGWNSTVLLDESAVTTCGSLVCHLARAPLGQPTRCGLTHLPCSPLSVLPAQGTMVGGFNKLGANDHIEKTVTELSGHSSVRIRAKLFKIDNWNNRKAQMYVDGSLAWESNLYGGQPNFGACDSDSGDCCGARGYQQGDLTIDMDITVAHTSASMIIRFTTNLDTGGSWGVNDVRVQAVGA